MRNKKSLFAYRQGMTLIEVMIVVMIISFLTVLVVGFLRTQVQKGSDAKRKGDLNRIKIALEEYEKDNDCYPSDPNILDCTVGTGLSPYLDKINCDPENDTSYYYEYDKTSSCAKWYQVFAKLTNNNDPDYTSSIGPDNTYSYYVASSNAPTVYETSQDTGYVGCKSGICVNVPLDPETGLPNCSTNYAGDSCNDTCGSPSNPLNECVSN